MATLTVNTGSMFSGKSTMLINQGEKHVKAGQRVIYIKPNLDNRYSEDEIVTHDGLKVRALSIEVNSRLTDVINPREVDVVLIDEVQFFNKRIVNSIWWLLSEDIKVYASGLDLNYLGDGFETTNEIMAVADKVNKLKAVCESCGEDAVITGKRNFSKDGGTSQIVELGAKETYIPLCRKCWFKFMTSGSSAND